MSSPREHVSEDKASVNEQVSGLHKAPNSLAKRKHNTQDNNESPGSLPAESHTSEIHTIASPISKLDEGHHPSRNLFKKMGTQLQDEMNVSQHARAGEPVPENRIPVANAVPEVSGAHTSSQEAVPPRLQEDLTSPNSSKVGDQVSFPPVAMQVDSITKIDNLQGVRGNGLELQGSPFGLENVNHYEIGGHHPVHLGDRYGENSQYKVIHKIGHGGFATVWLAQDILLDQTQGSRESQNLGPMKKRAKLFSDPASSGQNRYVALKIIRARLSTDTCGDLRFQKLQERIPKDDAGKEHLCLPIDLFIIRGPNGTHFCIVYPVLGPRVSKIVQDSEDLDHTLRHVSLQTIQATACLHRYGICHGDLTVKNILVKLTSLDLLSAEDIIKELGEPKKVPLVTLKYEEAHTLETAPRYMVRPIDFTRLPSKFITDKVQLIDFGECYEMSSPPRGLGIPLIYQPPEFVLDRAVGVGCDLWALGCAIFEIRTGRRFLEISDDREDYLFFIVETLGVFPKRWWNLAWDSRKEHYEDEPDSDGRPVRKPGEMESEMEPMVSLRELIAAGLYYEEEGIERTIPEGEARLMLDFFTQIFRYNAEERITAEAAMDHPWFKLKRE